MSKASIVLIDGDWNTLLLKINYHPHKGKWVPPGGGVGKGESTLRAAMRELKEETGIILEDFDIIHSLRWKSVDIYLIQVQEIPIPDLSHEHSDYIIVPFEEVFLYNLAPYVESSMTMLVEELQSL